MPRVTALSALLAAAPLAAGAGMIVTSRPVSSATTLASASSLTAAVTAVSTSALAAALTRPAPSLVVAAPVSVARLTTTPVSRGAALRRLVASPAQRLHMDVADRKREYLELCATEAGFGYPWRGVSDSIAWMECGWRRQLNEPFGPTPWSFVGDKVQEACDHLAQRSDAHPPDFDAADLVRLMYLYPPVPYVLASPTVGGGGSASGAVSRLAALTAYSRTLTSAAIAAAASTAAASSGSTTTAAASPPAAAPPPPPRNRLTRELGGKIRESLKGFKWWLDQGGPDDICFWSENHVILFASSEYLAGQLMPRERFSNTGWTGRQHKAVARVRLMRWLDERLKFGFSEWNSPGYYEEDFKALFNLVDFADDPQIKKRAAMVIDLLIFDLARLTHRGSFGVTSGRCYEKLGGDGSKWKSDGWRQSVGELIQMLFGTRGRFNHSGAVGALYFATSTYVPPTVLLAIGKDTPAHFVDRSRVSLDFSEASDWGIGFQGVDDAVFWWSKGAYMAKQTVANTRAVIRQHGVDNLRRGIEDALGFASGAFFGVSDGTLYSVANAASPITEGMCLTRANLYTYRNPDVMLSSVQDYRRGQIGPQQHIWQATLGMKEVVFTTLPGKRESDGPGYWTGNAAMPCAVQHENALIVAYDAPFITRVKEGLHRTHAWFPVDEFDEWDRRRGSNLHGAWGVTSEGTWLFAREGDGYIALYSNEGWDNSGPIDFTATGSWTNVFVCQVGNAAEFGTFQNFKDVVTRARIYIHYPTVLDSSPVYCGYDIPNKGRLQLTYGGTHRYNGQPIDLDFPRYDNNYCYQPFGIASMGIRHDGYRLIHLRDIVDRNAPRADTRVGDGL